MKALPPAVTVITAGSPSAGMVARLNQAVFAAAPNDIVLVSPGLKAGVRCLDHPRLAAYSSGRVASATPMNTGAGLFGLAEKNPIAFRPDFARLLPAPSGGRYPELPLRPRYLSPGTEVAAAKKWPERL